MSDKLELLKWELLVWAIKHRDEDGRAIRVQGKYTHPFGPRRDYTANLLVAVNACIKDGLLERYKPGEWEWPDYVLTPAGEAVAKGPKPAWNPKPPQLNDRDRGLLYCLTDKWQTPQDMGGGNGSHHSASLRKLCENGLAESSGRKYPVAPSIFARGKGSQRYRLTANGEAYCAGKKKPKKP